MYIFQISHFEKRQPLIYRKANFSFRETPIFSIKGMDSGKQVRCSFVDNAEYISMI